ncbi:MAG: hypothetical protein J6W66_06795 [Lachnospiraceae bacterium]|nr:hypothetical protein [Lachnospiraceae bacterium]
MIALIAVICFPLACLLGNALIQVVDAKKSRSEYFWEDWFLAGIFVMIGLAEGAHLMVLMRGRSLLAFSKTYLLLLIAFAVLSAAIVLFAFWRKKRTDDAKALPWKKLEKKELIALVLFLILVAVQIVLVIVRSAVFLEYDVTLETVVSFVKTDALYSVDPLTGLPYAQGMPMRLKILCLPTLYAGLSQFFGVSPQALVWHLIPVIALAFAYFAYISLARALFPKNRFFALLFLAVTALLVFVGDYGYGMEGFGLLHGGFQGTTIRTSVLVPYLISLCLRKKYRLMLLPVLVEACIVWTLYGIGMCVAVIALFFAAAYVRKLLARDPKKQDGDGKEGTSWANS